MMFTMTNIIYGVCLEGGEVETFTDADSALAKARELKIADIEALVSIVLWTDDPTVSY